MEDSLFVKTGGALVLFLAFKYQISGKNKNKMFRSETDLEPVNPPPKITGCGVGELWL